MKNSFLEHVARYLKDNHAQNLEDVLIIFPNKRASLFLKQHLAQYFDKPFWLPQLISSEEFVLNNSGLIKLDNISLVFQFYEVYKQIEGKEAETFDEFIQWAQILLHDFNEIDQYLIPSNDLFSFINEARALEVWNVDGSEITETQKKYLAFWKKLPTYYTALRKKMFSIKACYQGMAFRMVAERFEHELISGKYDKISHFIFVGFNALNQSEELIIDTLIKNNKATLLWDADKFYTEDALQESGLFLRRFKKKWKESKFLWEFDYWKNEPKNITITGVNGNINQSYYLSDLLAEISDNNQIQHTAVVLANEELLDPVLQSIPDNINHLNITMGYALENSPLHALWLSWIKLHENALKYSAKKNGSTYHYKDVVRILNHPFIKNETTDKIVNHIIKFNWVFIAAEKLIEQVDISEKELINICFTPWNDSPLAALKQQTLLVDFLRKKRESKPNEMEVEYLYKYKTVIDKLVEIYNIHHQEINSVKTIKLLFSQLVSKEKVDFYGEPLKGLQLMGVLETRTLDFDDVILLSANEGTIPAGKNSQSFIPFEIKRKFKLPTHIEKDALFAYHFYRLLQRAKNIHLVYNTDIDGFASTEKSRFITQMLYELPKLNPLIKIKENQLSFKLIGENENPTAINKLPELQTIIEDYLKNNGLSPSALNTYINCPLDFYYKYILKLRESEEVEEKVEANTMGDVMHKVLENIYQPYINKILDAAYLKNAISTVETLVLEAFKNHNYTVNELSYGKNYLTTKVIVKFITDFIIREIEFIETLKKDNQYLTILELEKELSFNYSVNGKEIKIKGFADRIDKIGNTIRIIDYKTGVVDKKELKINNLDSVISEVKYAKSLQLLLYGMLYLDMNPLNTHEIKPGIISFRKLSEGLMTLEIEKQTFNKDYIQAFKNNLFELIGIIIDTETPFVHNDNATYCNFCDI